MQNQRLLEILAEKVAALKEDLQLTGDPVQKFNLRQNILHTLDYQFFELKQNLDNTSDASEILKNLIKNLRHQIRFTKDNTDGIKTKLKLLKLLNEKVDYLKTIKDIEPDSSKKDEINKEIKKSESEILEIKASPELEGNNLETPYILNEEIDNIEILIQQNIENINKILREIMTRNEFLKYGILMAITLVLTVALSNLITSNKQKSNQQITSNIKILRPDVKWTLKSGFEEYEEGSSALFYDAPNRLKKKLEEMTGGRFMLEIEYKKDDEVGSKILSEVSKGETEQGEKIQCSFVGPYYDDLKYWYSLYFNCTIPFGLTAREHIGWLSIPCQEIDREILQNEEFKRSKEGVLKEDVLNDLTYAQTLYKRLRKRSLNIIPFPLAATGEQIGGWFMEKIDTLEQLKEVKMRIPAIGADVLRQLEVKVITDIQGDEILAKLGEGEINAAEWINPYDDFNHGLNQTFNYFYYPAWWEPSTTFEIQVNFDEWNELPSNYRAIFKSACWEIYLSMLAEYDRKNSYKLQEIKANEGNPEKHKVFIQKFSDDILEKAYHKYKNEVLDKKYRKIDDFEKVYEKWNNYKQQIQPWSNYLREVDTIINITEWKKRGWNKETQ